MFPKQTGHQFSAMMGILRTHIQDQETEKAGKAKQRTAEP
jgi:hypothetical protein